MSASVELATLEQVEQALLSGQGLDIVAPEQLQDDMVKRILEASDMEHAFQSFKATPVGEIEGIKVIVHGIAWLQSSFDEGSPVYALLSVTVDETGEPLTVSMGGRSLMASFLWAQRNKAMPFSGTFRKEQSRTNSSRAFWTFLLS